MSPAEFFNFNLFFHMACCIEDAKVAEIGDTDASLQISDPSSAHFASFLTDIPASLNDSLHDGLASIWTLCIEAPSEDKRRILTPAAAQHEEDISNDANQLERGQRRLRNITSSRGRNLANGRNQGSPKPIHLSAKQTYEYHAEARNPCRTPIVPCVLRGDDRAMLSLWGVRLRKRSNAAYHAAIIP